MMNMNPTTKLLAQQLSKSKNRLQNPPMMMMIINSLITLTHSTMGCKTCGMMVMVDQYLMKRQKKNMSSLPVAMTHSILDIIQNQRGCFQQWKENIEKDHLPLHQITKPEKVWRLSQGEQMRSWAGKTNPLSGPLLTACPG